MEVFPYGLKLKINKQKTRVWGRTKALKHVSDKFICTPNSNQELYMKVLNSATHSLIRRELICKHQNI